jgi:hypothetical protein
MNASKHELMRHALGVRPYSWVGGLRWSKPYRNHFVAGDDHVATWRALVGAGLAKEYRAGDLTGGMPAFLVTDSGRAEALAGLTFKRRWGYGMPTHA